VAQWVKDLVYDKGFIPGPGTSTSRGRGQKMSWCSLHHVYSMNE